MLKLEKQAKITLIVCIIQIIFYQLSVVFLPISTSDKLVIFLMILISLGVSTAYLTYSINCMVAGKCNVFAWIIAGFVIFGIVFALLNTTMAVAWGQKGVRQALASQPDIVEYVSALENIRKEQRKNDQQNM